MVSGILGYVWKVIKMENNYQLSRIHNYVHGLMNPEDMHALEREALEDPFLQDAIDGYRLQNGVDTKQLSLLQQRLASRVEAQADTRKKQFYSWQRLAIGMAAGVLFVAVCTLVLMRYLTDTKKSDLVEVQIMQDQVFDFNIFPVSGNDVEPVDGWKAFQEVLEKEILVDQEQRIEVSFNVGENGKASDIKIEGGSKESKDVLTNIIQNEISWKGGKANFYVEATKVKIP
jgi:hypothetical protein